MLERINVLNSLEYYMQKATERLNACCVIWEQACDSHVNCLGTKTNAVVWVSSHVVLISYAYTFIHIVSVNLLSHCSVGKIPARSAERDTSCEPCTHGRYLFSTRFQCTVFFMCAANLIVLFADFTKHGLMGICDVYFHCLQIIHEFSVI